MPPPNTPEDAEELMGAAIAIDNAARSTNGDILWMRQGQLFNFHYTSRSVR
jgi:hypothetical protein